MDFTDAAGYIRQHKNRVDAGAAMQRRIWEGGRTSAVPLHLWSDAGIKLPSFNTMETHYDSEKMLLNELNGAVSAVAGGMQAVPSVRANMGCGIYPTLFGLKQSLFTDKMPWLLNHLDKETIAQMGPEDLNFSDEFKAGLEHMEYMAERLAGTGVRVYPLDLQGPYDTAHLVYGDDIFYDMFDDPGFIHHLMELSVQSIFMGFDECLKRIPNADTEISHYNCLVMPRSMGGLKISEDTSTLLSRDHIAEFVTPYTNKVLERYGGGYIHYCGKNPHLFDAVMDDMPKAFGINLGNTDMHDMAAFLQTCAARGKVYYGSIIKLENESNADYFKRIISNATLDGRTYLLASIWHSVKNGESLEEIAAAWNAAYCGSDC